MPELKWSRDACILEFGGRNWRWKGAPEFVDNAIGLQANVTWGALAEKVQAGVSQDETLVEMRQA